MNNCEYIKLEKISLKNHPEYNEQWVQQKIADDPSILGLGSDLILKDKERKQPKGGRLDLLLQDDSDMRFEVELQLGIVDESHIIRTIEYWDIERKRYPQYNHTAVIIAEDITSRFFNVISLFNGFIPIVAIQLNAIKFDNKVSLLFTTILNQMELGKIEEDEVQEETNREYWEKSATKSTVQMADILLQEINKFEPGLTLKYNKFYIGLAKDGRANNFAVFRPKKKYLRLDVHLPQTDERDTYINDSDIELIDYSKREKRYRFRITKPQLEKSSEVLQVLLKEAYEIN